MKKIGVVFTTTQPVDNNTEQLIARATEKSDLLLIMVGSTNKAQNYMNPLSFEESRDIINKLTDHEKVKVIPLQDTLYNDAAWVRQVHDEIQYHAKNITDTIRLSENQHVEKYTDNYTVTIFTHDSSVADEYPKYESYVDTSLNPRQYEVLKYFYKGIPKWKKYFSETVIKFMEEFADTDKGKSLFEEYNYIQEYKKAWAASPYQPTFVTTDAVVYFRGYVLLVKRKAQPGKGLWALPGGFINQYEEVVDSLVRELKEETRIKVGKSILKSNIRHIEVFSDPYRSLRGRTITHAGLIVLDGVTSIQTLPYVKGDDDASHARWFSIQEINAMPTKLFEDHYHIIKKLLHIG